MPRIIQKAGHKPTVALLVGDYSQGLDELPQPNWRKAFIKLWAKWYKYEQNKALSKSLVLMNSHMLYNEYYGIIKNIQMVSTATLIKENNY